MSCETTTTSISFDISFRISKISELALESKFPVGSSASIIFGFFSKALKIATFCFWPPDSSEGL